jgi:hypothetical protein
MVRGRIFQTCTHARTHIAHAKGQCAKPSDGGGRVESKYSELQTRGQAPHRPSATELDAARVKACCREEARPHPSPSPLPFPLPAQPVRSARRANTHHRGQLTIAARPHTRMPSWRYGVAVVAAGLLVLVALTQQGPAVAVEPAVQVWRCIPLLPAAPASLLPCGVGSGRKAPAVRAPIRCAQRVSTPPARHERAVGNHPCTIAWWRRCHGDGWSPSSGRSTIAPPGFGNLVTPSRLEAGPLHPPRVRHHS